MERKARKLATESYINNLLNSDEGAKCVIVSGWLEPKISLYQSRCDQIAKELLDSEQMGTCSYHDGARIIFFHKSQLLHDWRIKLDFRCEKVQRAYTPSLYFIIVFKPFKVKGTFDHVVPSIVTPEPDNVSKSHHLDDNLSNRRSIQDDDEVLSGKSSIEDFEENFGEQLADNSDISLEDEQNESPEDQYNDSTGYKRSFDESRRPGGRRDDKYSDRQSVQDYEEDNVDEDYEPEVSKRYKSQVTEEEIVEKLFEMNEEEIIEYATDLNHEDRLKFMDLLLKRDEEYRNREPVRYSEAHLATINKQGNAVETDINISELQKKREDLANAANLSAAYIDKNYNVVEQPVEPVVKSRVSYSYGPQNAHVFASQTGFSQDNERAVNVRGNTPIKSVLEGSVRAPIGSVMGRVDMSTLNIQEGKISQSRVSAVGIQPLFRERVDITVTSAKSTPGKTGPSILGGGLSLTGHLKNNNVGNAGGNRQMGNNNMNVNNNKFNSNSGAVSNANNNNNNNKRFNNQNRGQGQSQGMNINSNSNSQGFNNNSNSNKGNFNKGNRNQQGGNQRFQQGGNRNQAGGNNNNSNSGQQQPDLDQNQMQQLLKTLSGGNFELQGNQLQIPTTVFNQITSLLNAQNITVPGVNGAVGGQQQQGGNQQKANLLETPLFNMNNQK